MALVSVVMPVFNVRPFVAAAIRSILAQTHTQWELLVLDDGSTDGTAQVVRSFSDSRIRLMSHAENAGLGARLNEGVSLATGEYIARMDGDDLAFPRRFEKQLNFLQANPEVDLLGTSMLIFRSSGEVAGVRRCGTWDHAYLTRKPWHNFYMNHPTWMGKVNWFRANPYRAEAMRMEDFDLLYRARHNSKYATIPEIVFGYREDGINLKKNLRSRKSTLRFFAKQFLSGDLKNGALGFSSQMLKAAVDLFASATGQERRLLRHRATPSDDYPVHEWEELYRKCVLADEAQPLVPTAHQ